MAQPSIVSEAASSAPLAPVEMLVAAPNLTPEEIRAPAHLDFVHSPDNLLEEIQTRQARGAIVLGSPASALSGSPSIIANFTHPILEQGFDLAIGRYSEGRFDGLINKALVYPLTRALYGLQIHYPSALDFSFSSKLADVLTVNAPGSTPLRGPFLSAAVAAGLRICEVNPGFAREAPKEARDLSSLLADALGPLFADMERNASLWQRSRASQPVPQFGAAVELIEPEQPSDVDISKLVDAFARGYKDLFEVWAQVLSPRTLLDLKKLARLAPTDFRFPDESWTRLVYEFALGHRQRLMSREHLLRSLTPLYLAWVASYALEVHEASSDVVDRRLERLCLTFEAGKPYLVSRWRWPDRFNP